MGSEFVVELPAMAAPIERAEATATRLLPAGPVPTAKRSVLVVDDNADAASLLSCMLRSSGHDVATVNDGRSAIATAMAKRPDLILLDIGLPDLDGYEVVRRLRLEVQFGSTLIVAVSGYSQEHDRQRALTSGFDEYLVKPVSPERILDLTLQPLRTRRMSS
jgi:CheY-like chemotaxis protein